MLAACGRLHFDPIGEPGVYTAVALPPGGVTQELAFAPDDSVRYAASPSHGPFRSVDHGATWSECAPLAARGIASDLATVYLSGPDDVYRSDDQCATWEPTGLGLTVNQLAMVGGDLYAASSLGLRKLANGTWTVVQTPLEGSTLMAVAADPSGQVIVAGARDALGAVTSTDGGASWTTSTGLSTGRVRRLAVASTTSLKWVAMESPAGVFNIGMTSLSSNAGASFVPRFGIGGRAAAISPTDPQRVVLGVFDGIRTSTDGLASVSASDQRTPNMNLAQINDLKYAPDGSLVAATDLGVFVAAEPSLAWQPMLEGLTGWRIYALLAHGQDVYAASDVGMLSSIAGAPFAHGSVAGMTLNAELPEIAIVDGAPSTLLAGGRLLRRSSDGGVTWQEVFDAGMDGFQVTSFAVIGQRVFAGTQIRMLVADPPYTTWTPHVIAGADHHVRDILATNTGLYCSTDDGLYVSTDQAATFTQVPLAATMLTRMTQLSDGTILVGAGDGVWASDPTATIWQRRGLDGHAVADLLTHETLVVAATSDSVHVSSNGGGTWQPLGALEGRVPASLAIDPTTGDLLVGTLGHGLWRTALPTPPR